MVPAIFTTIELMEVVEVNTKPYFLCTKGVNKDLFKKGEKNTIIAYGDF